MPSADDVFTHFGLSIFYEVSRHWFFYVIMIASSNILISRVWGRIKNLKEIAIFWACAFLLLVSAVTVLGSKPQEPNLIGGISAGLSGGTQGSHDTVAVLSMSIINTGSMQTIVKQWGVTAELNGTTYQGSIVTQPHDLTFDTSGHGEKNPTSVIHRAQDNILEKSLTPIQSGALVAGDLFVVFSDAAPEIFRLGAVVTVTYEDVFSKHYAVASKMGGKIAISLPQPGLHTEMVCPAPPGMIPPLPQSTPFLRDPVPSVTPAKP